jgi:hypothetical protein
MKNNLQRTHHTVRNKMIGIPMSIAFETTLYDLIEAVNEEVQPEEDQLVPFIVKDMLNTGRSDSWLQ